MKIIDSHMHLAQWVGKNGEFSFDLLEAYQKNNDVAYVDNMCCSNNADLWDGFEMDQTIFGAIAKLENPTVFTHGCLYLPEDESKTSEYDFKDQLEEMMELGLDGVKICDFKPDVYKRYHIEKRLNAYDEYVGYCEKYHVHMCWHVADPKSFWDPDKVSDVAKRHGWFYGDGTYPTYERLISLAYELLDHHPNLNVQLAHAFFKSHDPDEVIALLEKYPHVTLDLAPGWEMFSGFRTHYEKWYDIFWKYSNRFLFATDATVSASVEAISGNAQNVLRFLQTDDEFEVPGGHIARGIKLEQKDLENVLYRNHEVNVGKEPRKINKIALKKYIDRYLPLMPDSKNKQMTEQFYRKNLV